MTQKLEQLRKYSVCVNYILRFLVMLCSLIKAGLKLNFHFFLRILSHSAERTESCEKDLNILWPFYAKSRSETHLRYKALLQSINTQVRLSKAEISNMTT